MSKNKCALKKEIGTKLAIVHSEFTPTLFYLFDRTKGDFWFLEQRLTELSSSIWKAWSDTCEKRF